MKTYFLNANKLISYPPASPTCASPEALARRSDNFGGRGKLKASNGFGLIEVLISITILILVLSSAVAMQIASSRGIISVRQDIVAYNLAQEKIESIRKDRDTVWMDEDSSTDFSAFANDKIATNAPDSVSLGNRTFTRIVTYNFDPAVPDKLGMTVDVTWTERNQTRKITIAAALTDWMQF